MAAAPAAHSHAIESSLERLSALNDKLLLESRFGNGEPASDAVVRLVPPGGQPVEVGRTDGQGRLSFTLPSQASADWEVQVDGGPGHRDYLELPAGSGPAARVQGEPRLPLLAGRSPLVAVGLLGLGGLGLGLGSLQLLRRRQQRDRPSPTGTPR
jgi:nickel transport protein